MYITNIRVRRNIMEEEKNGISISEILKIVFSQKWLALIIAVVITVGGVLGLYLGYNSASTYYASSFSVDFPGSEKAIPVYPDNTPFNYRDITSRSNLLTVKNLDERFSDIDVGAMYDNSDIRIIRNTNKDNASTVTDTTYTIRIKAKYFTNYTQAEAFIDALARTPLRYIMGLTVKEEMFLGDYDQTDFYEDKVEHLYEHVEYLNASLVKLSQIAGGDIKNNSLRLISQLNQFTQRLNAAIGEMRSNYYVHNVDEVRLSYSSQLIALESQHAKKLRELELLFGKIQSGDPAVDSVQLTERMKTLAAEIALIEGNISVYSIYLAPDATMVENAEFADRLSGLGSQLGQITASYTQNLESYYSASSLVAYESAIHTEGDLHIIVCMLLSFAVGIIIAVLVAYSVGYIKMKKSAVEMAKPEIKQESLKE